MGKLVDISELQLECGLSASMTDEERAILATALVKAEGAVIRHLRYDPLQRSRTEYYPQGVLNYSESETEWDISNNQAVLRRISEAATSELQLQHLPIRNVATLHIDYDARSGTKSGSFAASTLQTEGTDFWPNYNRNDSGGNRLCEDGILRSVGSWPSEPGSVKIVYTAGYTLAELHGQDSIIDASQIVEVILEEAKRRVMKAFLVRSRTGVGFSQAFTSETLGDYTYVTDNTITNTFFGGNFDLLPESKGNLSTFVNWGYDLAS